MEGVGDEDALLELLGLFEVFASGFVDEGVADLGAEEAAQGEDGDYEDEQYGNDHRYFDAEAEGEECVGNVEGASKIGAESAVRQQKDGEGSEQGLGAVATIAFHENDDQQQLVGNVDPDGCRAEPVQLRWWDEIKAKIR